MSKKATEGKKVLNFIIGREGVGKTSYARSLLGSFVGKGEKTMLIVPKQFTFESAPISSANERSMRRSFSSSTLSIFLLFVKCYKSFIVLTFYAGYPQR